MRRLSLRLALRSTTVPHTALAYLGRHHVEDGARCKFRASTGVDRRFPITGEPSAGCSNKRVSGTRPGRHRVRGQYAVVQRSTTPQAASGAADSQGVRTVKVAEPTRRPVNVGASSSRPNKARQPWRGAWQISAQPMRRVYSSARAAGTMAVQWPAPGRPSEFSTTRPVLFTRTRRVRASSTGAVASGSVVLSCCALRKRIRWRGGHGAENIDTKQLRAIVRGSSKYLKENKRGKSAVW